MVGKDATLVLGEAQISDCRPVGILFQSESHGELAHCQVDGCPTGLAFDGASLRIEECEVVNAVETGVEIAGDDTELIGSSVTRCGKAGVIVRGAATLNGCRVAENAVGISVEGTAAKLELRGGVIAHNTGPGISLTGGAQGAIHQAEFEANAYPGVVFLGPGTGGAVHDAQFRDARSNCVAIRGGSHAEVVHNTIEGASHPAISVVDPDSQATIRQNTIRGVADNAIYVYKGAGALIENNDIETSGTTAVAISDSGTTADVIGNRISDASQFLVWYDDGASGRILDNVLRRSQNAAIAISKPGTDVVVRANRIEGAAEAGLAIVFGATADIAGNQVQDCQGGGLMIKGPNTTCVVKDNEIRNCVAGIVISEGAAGTFDGNRFADNPKGTWWLDQPGDLKGGDAPAGAAAMGDPRSTATSIPYAGGDFRQVPSGDRGEQASSDGAIDMPWRAALRDPANDARLTAILSEPGLSAAEAARLLAIIRAEVDEQMRAGAILPALTPRALVDLAEACRGSAMETWPAIVSAELGRVADEGAALDRLTLGPYQDASPALWAELRATPWTPPAGNGPQAVQEEVLPGLVGMLLLHSPGARTRPVLRQMLDSWDVDAGRVWLDATNNLLARSPVVEPWPDASSPLRIIHARDWEAEWLGLLLHRRPDACPAGHVVALPFRSAAIYLPLNTPNLLAVLPVLAKLAAGAYREASQFNDQLYRNLLWLQPDGTPLVLFDLFKVPERPTELPQSFLMAAASAQIAQ